jgi:circadian clock protein KaiC
MDEKKAEKNEALKRIPTGISGVDEAMMGGLIKDSINLIAGGPGSGKSIFAMEFLVNGATKFNEPGVYITFEETRENLIKDLKEFGWDLEKLEKEKKLLIISISPRDIKDVAAKKSFGLKYEVVRDMKARRIVFDSVTAYSLLFKDELEKRDAYTSIFDMLREWGCTTLMIAEYDAEEHKGSLLDFEVDSIIYLYNMKKQDTRTRALEIYKMRGTKHSAKIFPLEITDKGIVIYPDQTVF